MSDKDYSTIKVTFVTSTGCGPCATIKPTMLSLQKELGFKMEIINATDEPDVIAKLGVRSAPTLIFEVNGLTTKVLVGIQSKRALLEVLNKIAV